MTSHVHGLQELALLKYPYYPKQFNAIPIKIPMAIFFREMENAVYLEK